MNFAQLIDPEKVYRDDPLALRPAPLPPRGAVLHTQVGDAVSALPMVNADGAEKSRLQIIREAVGTSGEGLSIEKILAEVGARVAVCYVHQALGSLVQRREAVREGEPGRSKWKLTDQGRKRLEGKGMTPASDDVLGGMTLEEVEGRLVAGELNEAILVAFKAHLLHEPDEHEIQPMLGRLCDLALVGYRAQQRGAQAMEWSVPIFGEITRDEEERALRFAEEAIELVNAIGLSRAQLESVAERVYGRSQGLVASEAGQALFTLEALAANSNIDLQAAAQAEFERVRAIPREEWQQRHQAKVAAGIAK